MFSVITNIYNKKTIGLTLMELLTATGKLIFKLLPHTIKLLIIYFIGFNIQSVP